MKTLMVLILAFAVTLGFLQRPAKAQRPLWQQNPNQMAAGEANQGRMGGAAQFQSGQLAQLMITNFDRDRDGALNAVELQAGLTALLLRMSAGFGLGQMAQFGDQGLQQQAAGFQGRVPGAFGRGQLPPFGNQGVDRQALGFQGRRGIAAGAPERGGRVRGQ